MFQRQPQSFLLEYILLEKPEIFREGYASFKIPKTFIVLIIAGKTLDWIPDDENDLSTWPVF